MSSPLTQSDFYKVSHKKFMHKDCTKLYINFTARSGKYAKWADDDRKVVFFGLQKFMQEFLIGEFNHNFFYKPAHKAIGYLQRRCDTALGQGAVSMDHIRALWQLGYLPLSIKALPEGSKVPFKVPLLTMVNTHDDFAWLITYLETVMSQELWGPTTSATTAYQFLKLCNKWADKTVGNRNHVPFQCHDFSARGMFGRHAAAMSGSGHLLSFVGTDTIASIDLLEEHYYADAEKELIGTSVPASEHSVTSLGIAVDGELATIKRWITEDYPKGIVSVVADTIDYWKVITEYLPSLKTEILNREKNELGMAKVVVRPDSGCPVKIICGYDEFAVGDIDDFEDVEELLADGVSVINNMYDNKFYSITDTQDYYGNLVAYYSTEISKAEVKGSIEVLWDTFGGTINEKGYKELNPAVGLIYGDSITLERAQEIFERLEKKGFASSNVVFGVGSYTYQMVSRDTLGMAVKATYAEVNGKGIDLFKDPITDDGTKKSAKGLMRVENVKGEFVMFDQQTHDQESTGELVEVFRNGNTKKIHSLSEIRNRLQAS